MGKEPKKYSMFVCSPLLALLLSPATVAAMLMLRLALVLEVVEKSWDSSDAIADADSFMYTGSVM